MFALLSFTKSVAKFALELLTGDCNYILLTKLPCAGDSE